MSFFYDLFGLLFWLITQIFFSFYNLFYAITHPLSWLNWSDKEAIMKFIYYGGSQELFFVFLTLFLFITIIANIYDPLLGITYAFGNILTLTFLSWLYKETWSDPRK